MALGKDDVVEVLSDFRLQSIRFTAGPIHVNVTEYDRVSDYFDTGAIEVKQTKKVRKYVPLENTLYLNEGDPRGDFSMRSGIVHECTHVISDINKVEVTRLHDEAAAYLAQYAFLRLLDPGIDAPPLRGDPGSDLMRVGLSFVDKYGLGQPKGYGALIAQEDINTMGRLVQRHPEYSEIKEDEALKTDGVKLDKSQLTTHKLNEAARETNRTKYEAWLMKTVLAAQVPGKDGAFAYQQLSQHFFMVYKPIATVLLSRFLSVNAGDRLSVQFGKFSDEQKADLIRQLRIPKPPG